MDSIYFLVKSKFVARELGDELILVPLTGSIAMMNELFTFNASAKLLWNELSPDSTELSLAGALQDRFKLDEAIALTDVKSFLTQLAELGRKYC